MIISYIIYLIFILIMVAKSPSSLNKLGHTLAHRIILSYRDIRIVMKTYLPYTTERGSNVCLTERQICFGGSGCGVILKHKKSNEILYQEPGNTRHLGVSVFSGLSTRKALRLLCKIRNLSPTTLVIWGTHILRLPVSTTEP